MKCYFDTSVLIAAFVEDEIHHRECAELVARTEDGIISDHGLLECFSMLTGGRLSVRLTPEEASHLIKVNILGRMILMPLTVSEKIEMLRQCQGWGVRGGAIYDALHLATARKAAVEKLYTLNVRHFVAIAADFDAEICQPET